MNFTPENEPRASLWFVNLFRMFAVRNGFEENDPLFVRALEALGKVKRGELSPAVADATLDPIFEALNTHEPPTRDVAMVADSRSMKAAPLRKVAKDAGIDENDPLLLRALKAQENADWRTNWRSWEQMEIAVWAFIAAHIEVKPAWPPEAEQIETLLRKLERGEATADEKQEFRTLAAEVLQEWQPQYPAGYRERIESAMNLLGPATGENGS